MADKYFSESGDILNDGAEATPYKYFRQAELNAATTDVIVNAASTAVNSGADGAISRKYRGGTYDGAFNAKNGEHYVHADDKTYWCQDLTKWTSAGGFVLATTGGATPLVGTECAYNAGTVNGRLRGTVQVTDNARFRVRYIVKNTGGSMSLQLRNGNGAGDWYDFGTDTWNASIGTHHVIGSTASAWVEGVTGWVEAGDSGSIAPEQVRVDLYQPSGQEAWIQAVWIEIECQWTQYSGDVYSCPLPATTSDEVCNAVFVGNDRISGLRYKATSLAGITAGQFWHEVGIALNDGQLFYQLDTGEDSTIFDDNIYAINRNTFLEDSADVTLSHMTIKSFERAVITTTGATKTDHVTCLHNYQLNFQVNGTGSQVNIRPIAKHSQGDQAAGGPAHPKGFFVSDTAASTGSMVCLGAISEDIYDDHFQITGGDLTVHGFFCAGSVNGSGISAHCGPGSTGDIVMHNGTIYNTTSGVGGIRDQNGQAGNKLTLSGVAVICADGITNAFDYNTGAAAVDLTDSSTNNFFNGDSDASFAPYFTDVGSIAGFKLNNLTEFAPDKESPLVGVGTKTWAGYTNPISYSGEPYSDIDTDAGGVQSTYGPFHPTKL